MPEFIYGCGYLGRRLAIRRQHENRQITGVVRTVASAEALAGMGIGSLQVDLDVDAATELAPQGSTLFYFIPPAKSGETDTRVRRLIEEFARQGHPRRIVYLSTTGVYGDCQGEWVTEERPVNPVFARAKRRWDAECRLREWRADTGGELVILRVAGIYGPGKLPLERLRKGLPLVRAEESPWTNRIHIDDLVQVCVAAMDKGSDGAVYNVSDGSPGTMIDYFSKIAELAGLPAPPAITLSQAAQQLSEGMLSYMHESRRLDNSRMRDELGVTLLYPGMDVGLSACFD